MLVTTARTVVVTRERGQYPYSSFDNVEPTRATGLGANVSSRPTLSIGAGQLGPSARNHKRYEFRNGPWTYKIDASADNRFAGATLTVLRAARMVQTSLAATYQMSANRIIE